MPWWKSGKPWFWGRAHAGAGGGGSAVFCLLLVFCLFLHVYSLFVACFECFKIVLCFSIMLYASIMIIMQTFVCLRP